MRPSPAASGRSTAWTATAPPASMRSVIAGAISKRDSSGTSGVTTATPDAAAPSPTRPAAVRRCRRDESPAPEAPSGGAGRRSSRDAPASAAPGSGTSISIRRSVGRRTPASASVRTVPCISAARTTKNSPRANGRPTNVMPRTAATIARSAARRRPCITAWYTAGSWQVGRWLARSLVVTAPGHRTWPTRRTCLTRPAAPR